MFWIDTQFTETIPNFTQFQDTLKLGMNQGERSN
jgi:hypothetical protein